ncbi:Tetratricopeptide repeat protein [uncultured archaeon]|nr:Tetratricopeptide repeat protein [uncultured archaeon]
MYHKQLSEWFKKNFIGIFIFVVLVFLVLLLMQGFLEGTVSLISSLLSSWLNDILKELINKLYPIPWVLLILLWVIIMLVIWEYRTRGLVSIRLHFMARRPAEWMGRLIKWLNRDWRPPVLLLVLAAILVAFFTYGSGMYSISSVVEVKDLLHNNNYLPLANSVEAFDGQSKSPPVDNVSPGSTEGKGSTPQKGTPLYNATLKLEEWWSGSLDRLINDSSTVPIATKPNNTSSTAPNANKSNITSPNISNTAIELSKSSNTYSIIWTILLFISKVADYFINNIIIEWPKILILWVFIYLIKRAWAAHKRVVIESFENKMATNYDGGLIKETLALKLTDLNDIYSKANETRAILTSSGFDQPLQANISVPELDFSNTLAGMVKPSEGWGWLKPVDDSIKNFIGYILDPPKIKGNVYINKDLDNKDILILTAYIYGGDRPHNSWKVSKKIDSMADPNPGLQQNPQKDLKSKGSLSDKETAQSDVSIKNAPEDENPTPDQKKPSENNALSIEEQINELAYRIFTDLVFNPSRRELVRWKATSSFYEGLTAYRASLRSRLNKKLRLIDAEKKFLETLAEDERFNFVYFNLGVVYNELENWEAAKIAFSKSIEKDPDQWEAYYALGLNLYREMLKPDLENKGKEKRKEIIKLCEQAISLGIKQKEKEAKVYDLIGLAQRFQADEKSVLNDLIQKNIPNLKDSIESHQKAVTLSYWALYNAERKGKDTDEIKRIITKCLQDLATDYYYQDYNNKHDENAYKKAEILLKEAISILPSDADLHVRLGQIYGNHNKHKKEVKEFEIARSIDPNELDLLPYLAKTYWNNKDMEMYKYERDLCLDSLPMAYDDIDVIEKIKYLFCHEATINLKKDYLERLIEQKEYLKKLKRDLKECKDSLDDLDWRLSQKESERKIEDPLKDPLIYAISAIFLKKSYLKVDTSKMKTSINHCITAIDRIKLEPEEMKIFCSKCIKNIDNKFHNKKFNLKIPTLADYMTKPDAHVEEIAYKNITDKNNAIYYACNKIKEAINILEEIKSSGRMKEDANAEVKTGNENLRKARAILEDSMENLSKVEKKNELEYGDICILLGDLYLNLDSSEAAEKAEHYYKAAMNSLKGHPLKLVKIELQTKISQALLIQSRLVEAQRIAEESINSDPLNYIDRKTLGTIFFVLKDYEDARIAWEKALLLKPDDPISRFNTGVSYILEAQEETLLINKNERFELAAKNLKEALILLDSEQSNINMRAHYWLGIIYKNIKQYDQAIYQLHVSKTLAIKGELQPDELIIGFVLSKLYINNNMHEKGEEELKAIIEKSANLLKNYSINKLCGEALGLKVSIGYIVVKVHLKLCFLYARQAVAYTEDLADTMQLSGACIYIKSQNRLDMALDLAHIANKYVKEMKEKEKNKEKGLQIAREKEILEKEVDECEGALLDCYGWIAYEMGILGKSERKEYAETRIDEAILLLESSVSKNPNPRAYVHLAIACKKKLEFLGERINEIDEATEIEANEGEDPAKVDQRLETDSPPKKNSLSDQKTKSKSKLTTSQRELKRLLVVQKAQKEFCIRQCYGYVKVIENKGQYAEDYPEEYSNELAELKDYIEKLDSVSQSLKTNPPQQEPKPNPEQD